MKEQLSIRLPEESLKEIEDLKKFYKLEWNDVEEPSTTDIIRLAIHYSWYDKNLQNILTDIKQNKQTSV